MNTNGLARHYGSLTPEERFRLILAARNRGDEAERDRLMNAATPIVFAMPDHSPYAHALGELSLLIFIELLEEAARYLEALDRADDPFDFFEEDETEEEPAAGRRRKKSLSERSLDLALAAGFVLRTKAAGWKVFCERMTLSPFAVWEGLPGLERLQRALALAEKAAFVPEGFLSWLNDRRPPGEPERTEVPPWLTVEGVADATAKMFQGRVAWWRG
jgi:hypothetical protein